MSKTLLIPVRRFQRSGGALKRAQRETPRDEAWFWSDAGDVAKVMSQAAAKADANLNLISH